MRSGKAADIVVRFDRDRRSAGERHALDHVGIERALGQEFGAANLLCFGFEHIDEQFADGLALCSGSSTPASALRKISCRFEHE